MGIRGVDRRSLWWGGAPEGDVPPGDLPASAEVLIVGAGLTGLTTAVRLARAGLVPTVIEARRPGSGTTGHSSAKVSLLQGSMLQRLARHASTETVRAYVAANRSGQQWLLDLLRTRDVPFDTRLAMTYAVTRSGARDVEAERRASKDAGLEIVDVDQGDLPFPVVDAIGLPDQAQINPVAAARALVAELEELGGHVIEGVRMTGASFAKPWTVATTAGEVRAEHLVLATQAPILDRSLDFARLKAYRSYVLAYPVDDLASVPQSMSLSLDEPTRSLRTATTDDGDFLLVGGNGHEVGRGGSTQARVDEIHAWATAHLPVGEPAWSWSAQDYHLTTQVPRIGAVPGTDGRLHVATGYDKWGMALASAAGELISGDILGSPPAYAEALRAHGIRPADITESAVHGAAIGGRLVGDRARLVLPDEGDTPAEGEGRVEGSPVRPTAVSTVEGTTCALSAVCTHLGGIVSWNDAERSWDCPLHGSRFAPDGTLIEGPATGDLSSREG